VPLINHTIFKRQGKREGRDRAVLDDYALLAELSYQVKNLHPQGMAYCL
jgi:hypothetical protein